MNVALAHDYLNQFGGAERFLESLMNFFPEAPIYTLLYSEKKTLERFKHRTIKTSILNNPLIINNHRHIIPFLPLASQLINISDEYDLLISSTAGYAKGFSYNSQKTFHISYCYTPLRYAWEDEEYLHTHPIFQSKPLFQQCVKPLTSYLRTWDYSAGQKPDILIATSHFIAEKIRKNYGRDPYVIYPGTDLNTFFPEPKKRDYFLAIGRLLHYKKFDLVIDAFNALKLPLKIVGTGPEKQALMARVKSPYIEFVDGNIKNDKKLRDIYSGARALIFPQVEDFGLVAVEAIACGTPVIAYKKGGAEEIIKEHRSGIFFNEQTKEALIHAVHQFNSMHFNPWIVRREAESLSTDVFREQFLAVIEDYTTLRKERLSRMAV